MNRLHLNLLSRQRGTSVLQKVLPWLVLMMAFPVMCGVNWGFLKLFSSQAALSDGSLSPFHTANHTLQGAHVHTNRDPQKLFADFYLILGSQLAGRGQMIAAERMLGEAVGMTPNNPVARMNYGVVLESLDKFDQALEQYNQALILSPRSVQALYNTGLLQDKMGFPEKGVQSLLNAQLLEPNNAMLNYDVGVLYAKLNDFPKSAKFSLLAIESKKDFAEAYNNYGYALTHMGEYQKALAAIDTSLKLKPDSAATIDSKGFVLFGMGKYAEALAQYDEALKLDATIGEIYLHIAQAQEKLKRLPEAIQNYSKYLELTPKAMDRADVEQVLSRLKAATGVATDAAAQASSSQQDTKASPEAAKPVAEPANVPAQ